VRRAAKRKTLYVIMRKIPGEGGRVVPADVIEDRHIGRILKRRSDMRAIHIRCRSLPTLLMSLPIEDKRMPPSPAAHNSAHSYRAALVNDGWIQIGQGAGGTVHSKASEKIVVKVSEGDDAYLAFVRFVLANASPCLPVVTLIHQSQNWAVIHIELLVKLSPAASALVATWWAGYVAAKKSKSPLPPPAEWSNTADCLQAVAIANNCGFDMKADNAMQRLDGTIVFTDPLF
jgi:hypothetical protein